MVFSIINGVCENKHNIALIRAEADAIIIAHAIFGSTSIDSISIFDGVSTYKVFSSS